jgi:alkylation response protein AidB-like acyl-CoA dehydrogenase
VLERHVGSPLTELDPDALLRWAIDARLAAGEHATRAVSDALQALGGYGYMDEYGLSKRLRDVTALRVLHGGPDQLLLARDHRRAAS